MSKFVKYFIAIAIPLLASGIGSLFTTPSIPGWYTTLVKPSFNPPSWVFGPVWTILFIMMGVAFALIWMNKQGNWFTRLFKKEHFRQWAFTAYFVQLTLNVFWSIFFFGLHNPLLAFIDIVFLWFAIATNIYFFYKINKTAGYLLIPYLLWVSFASVLNLTIVLIN
ncbi:MAG TPA: tryptophan-rich sensory protein [Candidatus Magasanikbacteria bacterium]|nr:tryptophan-rich sensory protein [Candidatus Magasanikbacteria bacterium]